MTRRQGPDTLLALGRTARYRAEAHDDDGKVMPGIAFTWSVDLATVVSLSRDDNEVTVEAVGNGPAVLTASAQGVAGTAVVVVWQRVGDVQVTPDNRELEVFESVDLTARAWDIDEHPVTRILQWEWTTDRDYTLSIVPHAGDHSKAKVTRVFGGRTIITVRAEGQSDAATIR